MNTKLALVAVAFSAMASASNAFYTGFETVPGNPNPSGGTMTSLTIADVDMSITITRLGGTAFDVYSEGAPSYFDGPWRTQALTPFFVDNGSDFLINFSKPVTAFTVETGDFGGDSDTAQIFGYSGVDASGSLLATDSGNWGLGDFNVNAVGTTPLKLSITSLTAPMKSVVLRGGTTSIASSLFWDEINAVAVPEPASMLALAAGVAGIMTRPRIQKRS